MFEIGIGEPRSDEADAAFFIPRVENPVDPPLPHQFEEPGIAPGDHLLLLEGGDRWNDDPVFGGNGAGVEGGPVPGVERREAVGVDGDAAAAVGLVGGHQEGDVERRLLRELEADADPVLDFLKGGRFEDRHVEVLGEEARVGRHLGAFRPGVVTHRHQGTGLPRGPGHVAQRQPVGGHVHPHALHDSQGAHLGHLGAVEAGGGHGLVVGDLGYDSAFVEQVPDVLEGVEELGQRRPGVPGDLADRTLQGSFHDQFVARENSRAIFFEESGIHGLRCSAG